MTSAAITPLPASASTRYPLRYAVVDVETTGLHAPSDRVLQIAVAQMEPDGTPGRTWSTLVDPGCDPGPVHIHGITRERLAGAPRFDHVVGQLAGLLDGRVLVAHNAAFDWKFLAAEAHRAVHPLPVSTRLCTVALSRRLDLPTPSLSLAALAAHWGVTQARPHDAEDDTRVLTEILRHSLAFADTLAVELPLSACDAADTDRVYPARLPRPACPWTWPGRWTPGRRLIQGVKVAITGSTATARDALAARAAAAGLDVMNTVSGKTGMLVTNDPAAGTSKLRAAAMYAVPVVDEATFTALLAEVEPGTPRAVTRPAVPAPRAARAAAAPAGPLSGRCLLVLGGTHADAAEVRNRIADLGGIAAVNLTARVTDVVALPGAGNDRRWATVTTLGLPVRTPEALEPAAAPDAGSDAAPAPGAAAAPAPVTVLSRGAVADLPGGVTDWTISVTWPTGTGAEVDVVAFLTDADELVHADADFVFYNQPAAADGSVELTLDVPHEALVDVRLGRVPDDVSRIVIAATVTGDHTFGDLGPVEFVARTGDGSPQLRTTLDAATTERSLLLAHVYRRDDRWRLRAIGQGYDHGLAELATLHGVTVDED
ncbi:TerD family protein [Dactylosporangium sp. NPDC050688]|uniref:TerD family protein n=1 Tax=Dactylosporangium sp. NPDC050688 TaxID=3157217 RepID=UPI0033F8078B